MDTLILLTAKYAIVLPVAAALYTLVILKDNRKRLDFCLLLAIGGAISLGLALLGSRLISDPRPFVAGHFTPLLAHGVDNGFPSDHTLLASFLGFAVFTRSRRLGIAVLFIAACIGIARVAAGVHHLEDIIGSFVITGAATLIALAILRAVRPNAVPSAQADE